MQTEEGTTSTGAGDRKYKGARRRSWGKWVSEIRVPGSRERLWLGSYSNPEAAAVAHDTAVFFLRGPDPADGFNFPDRVGRFAWTGLSPRSVQKVATDSGMAVDAELAIQKSSTDETVETAGTERADVADSGVGWGNGCFQDISFDDMYLYM